MSDHDGLSDAERVALADEWNSTAGAPVSEREATEVRAALSGKGRVSSAEECSGYHNGRASRRAYDGDSCMTCGLHKPPVEVPVCDCEPEVFSDGSVLHEDICNLANWCPHEVGAYVCFMPCGCRCDSCLRLALGNAAYDAARRENT